MRYAYTIKNTDSVYTIYETLQLAANRGNCDVVWEHGTYIFGTDFYDWMYSQGIYVGFELPIGRGNRYYFNDSTIIGEYTGNNSTVHSNCNVMGRRQFGGSFEIYDATIIAKDIVYCVHDDGSKTDYPHIHNIIKGCRLEYIGGEYAKTNYICKPLGGGANFRGVTEVKNSILLIRNATRDTCASWHGLSVTPPAGIELDYRVELDNVYMNGTYGIYHSNQYDTNQNLSIFVHSSAFSSNINGNNVEEIAMNNTILTIANHSVTYNLTNVTASVSPDTIRDLNSLTLTLSGTNMQVTVMMGDADITNTSFDETTGSVTIDRITDNVVITASAD